MGWFGKRKPTVRPTPQPANARVRLKVEGLEDRSVPALVASQVALAPPLLESGEVQKLIQRAAAATASDDAIIAIVDRGGNILGVRVEGQVSPTITGNQEALFFAIDGAISKARTAAFFANDQAPLTSRTIQFISQSTMTEREVNSNPNYLVVPDPTRQGPGFVAPIGIGGHFPPNIPFTPQVDLFLIEHTNRDSLLNPGPDHIKGTADDVPLMSRFNAMFDAGVVLNPPFAYGEAILDPNDRDDFNFNHYQSRGIATLPGGIPIYQDGVLVGGIGVFFPGETGYASEENSSLSVNFDRSKPDRTLEAEFIGLAAVNGSQTLGLQVGTLGGIPPVRGIDFPGGGRIDLVGITLDIVGPGGDRGPLFLVQYATENLGVNQGSANSGTDMKVTVDPMMMFIDGTNVPEGWLVSPQNGVGITAAEVERAITQGINEANKVRAQIRLPDDQHTAMVFAVSDKVGNIVGLYRMHDATVFSLDVAVAKARNTAYYNNPAQLKDADQLPGIAKGVAFTNRTFRYLSLPHFPEGIDDKPPAPFSILHAPGINPLTGLNTGAPLPLSAYTGTVVGRDAFFVGTNFRAPTALTNQNGIVFFPGSSGVYRGSGNSRTIVGGYGVSGDGVDQDDVVTAFGIIGLEAPANLQVDRYFLGAVRLPYLKFPRNPEEI